MVVAAGKGPKGHEPNRRRGVLREVVKKDVGGPSQTHGKTSRDGTQAPCPRERESDEARGKGKAKAVEFVLVVILTVQEADEKVQVWRDGRSHNEARPAGRERLRTISNGEDMDREPRDRVAHGRGHFARGPPRADARRS
jgi:hypothetical protein